MAESEFKINQHFKIIRNCPTCRQDYGVDSGGQKSGASPAIHVDNKTGRAQGYCSSLCMAKALGVEDVTESLAFQALRDMGIDPLTMLAPKIPHEGYTYEQLMMMEYILKMKLQAEGRMADSESGRLELPWTTDKKNMEYQRYAARLIFFKLSQLSAKLPGKVIGVPTMDFPFAATLALELGVRLYIPQRSKHSTHISVTQLQTYTILVGDTLGSGDRIIPEIDYLQKQGVELDFAVFHAIDLHQSGFRRLIDKGVEPIGALTIKGMTPSGKFNVESTAIHVT